MKKDLIVSSLTFLLMFIFCGPTMAQNQQMSPLPGIDLAMPTVLPTLPPTTNGSLVTTFKDSYSMGVTASTEKRWQAALNAFNTALPLAQTPQDKTNTNKWIGFVTQMVESKVAPTTVVEEEPVATSASQADSPSPTPSELESFIQKNIRVEVKGLSEKYSKRFTSKEGTAGIASFLSQPGNQVLVYKMKIPCRIYVSYSDAVSAGRVEICLPYREKERDYFVQDIGLVLPLQLLACMQKYIYDVAGTDSKFFRQVRNFCIVVRLVKDDGTIFSCVASNGNYGLFQFTNEASVLDTSGVLHTYASDSVTPGFFVLGDAMSISGKKAESYWFYKFFDIPINR